MANCYVRLVLELLAQRKILLATTKLKCDDCDWPKPKLSPFVQPELEQNYGSVLTS